MPKNFSGPAPSQQHQPQAERVFSESPRSQPETIFGRRPEAFTQFVHRDPHRFPNDWPHSFGGFPEEEFGFRQTESPSRFGGAKPQQHSAHPQQQQQQQCHRQEAPPPTHSQKQPPQPQEQQKAPEPPKQPQPQKQPLGPIEQIQAIQKDVSTLLRQVEAFNGAPRDKNYLYLDEMLTRNLLKLDNVDTQGQDSIRSARKEAIKCIERTISLLEAKAAANVAPKEDKTELEPQSQGEKMETEASAAQEPSTMEMSPPPTQNDTTEVNSEASQEASSKSGEGEATDKQPKSVEAVENVEGQTKKEEEVKSEEQPQKTEDADVKPSVEEAQVEEPKKEESAEAKTEVKEGEKKEKKKIKKKVNKEDKEKKQ